MFKRMSSVKNYWNKLVVQQKFIFFLNILLLLFIVFSLVFNFEISNITEILETILDSLNEELETSKEKQRVQNNNIIKEEKELIEKKKLLSDKYQKEKGFLHSIYDYWFSNSKKP